MHTPVSATPSSNERPGGVFTRDTAQGVAEWEALPRLDIGRAHFPTRAPTGNSDAKSVADVGGACCEASFRDRRPAGRGCHDRA